MVTVVGLACWVRLECVLFVVLFNVLPCVWYRVLLLVLGYDLCVSRMIAVPSCYCLFCFDMVSTLCCDTWGEY